MGFWIYLRSKWIFGLWGRIKEREWSSRRSLDSQRSSNGSNSFSVLYFTCDEPSMSTRFKQLHRIRNKNLEVGTRHTPRAHTHTHTHRNWGYLVAGEETMGGFLKNNGGSHYMCMYVCIITIQICKGGCFIIDFICNLVVENVIQFRNTRANNMDVPQL